MTPFVGFFGISVYFLFAEKKQKTHISILFNILRFIPAFMDV